MTRKISSIISALFVLTPLSICQAGEASRLDVLVLLNREARSQILNPDDHLLTIEKLKIPRVKTEIGGVCGAIVSLRSKPDPNQKRSYRANLVIEDGRLAVGTMTTFFMPLTELIEQPACH